MKKLTTLAAAAALSLPTLVQAGGLDPVIIVTPPEEPQVTQGSLGSATPWLIAGAAILIIALASGDGDEATADED